MASQLRSGLLLLALALGWTSLGRGQPSQPASTTVGQPSSLPAAGGVPSQPTPSNAPPGTITATVIDQSGAVVAGAHVRLTIDTREPGDPSVANSPDGNPAPAANPPITKEALTSSDGQFSFSGVTPGSFHLTITATGFATQTVTGTVGAGQIDVMPPILLGVADALTEVRVGLSQVEVAEEQIHVEEKQRVLGVIPNFYVSYVPDAAPLTSKQKFKLAARTVVDPVTFGIVGAIAGVEQAQNHFAEYGQGAQGYGKRFGAGYADTVTGTFIGSAILPSLLKQDPRYFYKGAGSKTSRALYAIANAVICKGDNGRWQPNYSNVLGNLAAGGISNLYYPAQDRDDAALSFENAAIGLGASAIGNLFQEFIIKKLTPKLPSHLPGEP